MAPKHALTPVRQGTVTRIWYGSDPTPTQPRCDDEVCSRLEVQPERFRRRPLYVSYSAVLDVMAGRVILQLDAASVQAQAWHTQPAWIAAAGDVQRTRWAPWAG